MTLSMEQYLTTDDSQSVVYGYRKSRWRQVLTYTVSCLFAGLPFLLFHWVPTWLLYATCIRCSFQIADRVLVVETYQKKCKSFYIHMILHKDIADTSGLLNEGFDDDGNKEKEPIESVDAIHTPIHLDDGTTLNVQNYRYFRHKKQSLIWDGSRAQWTRLAGIESGASCAQLQAMGATPPSSERRVRMLNIYGLNEINVPVQSIMTLILLEVFNPFYVFQLFTIAVWLAEPYYYYCIAVVLMSTFGVATSVIQTKKNQSNLRATVEAHDTVELWDGRRVDSRAVSPGDIIVLPPRGCTLHFDAALLTGAAVLNESMLTGDIIVLPPRGCTLHFDAALLTGAAVLNESMLTGDIIVLPPRGCTLHFDAALLTGAAVLNESMLTGDIIVLPPRGCTLHFDAALLTGAAVLNESMLTGDIIVLPPRGCTLHFDAALLTGAAVLNESMLTGDIIVLPPRGCTLHFDAALLTGAAVLNESMLTVEAHDTVELWDGRRVDSRAVSPGDIIVLPPRGCTLHFDAALLTGAAVLNESMLTGDIIVLPPRGCTLHFDAALLTGAAVLNESMLTGDIIVLPPRGCTLHFDAALLTGAAVLNESMLTGDIIVLPPRGCTLHFDAALLTGAAVLNESMLTGDIIVLPPRGCTLHFDAALLTGAAVLNESMLTGDIIVLPPRGCTLHFDTALLTGAAVLNESMLTGDIIVLPPRGCTLHFDAALLTGAAVLNESMLTGDIIVLPPRGCTLHFDAALLTGAAVLNESMLTGDIIVLPPRGCTLHFDAALLTGAAVLNESMLTGDIIVLPPRGCTLHFDAALLTGAAVLNESMLTGDIIVLPPRGCTLHFDAALLTGAAVLNESMLTGESVPVTKTALLRVDRPFDLKEHASSVLFCGTRVIQTRYYNNEPVKALVLRTGYNTSKGQLVRSILYPVPADFKFDRDSYKFIIILACIAALGLAYTIALKAYRNLSPGDITIKALDIITIVIPPALPAAMTVGRLYAVSRLKRARVACLNTRAVNVSGSLDCVCFDKTGTLTEDGLDMWGVVAVSGATSPPRLGRPQRDPRQLNELHPLKLAMAACHSLTLLDNELAGDPLDLKMFESTGWVLEEPEVPEHSNYEILTPTIVKPRKTANIDVDDIHLPLEVGIVQQHQFVSSLQRASVVTRVLGEDVLRVYTKGAPEMLKTLCTNDTVPDNLFEVLNSYAEKGYRVIAVATRVLEVTFNQLQKMTREEVERDLEFLGLVIMENRLKAATTGIIRELKEANIHVVMITGDNVLTAVSVAKECGILMGEERVVHLHADTSGTSPVIYCESTLHGASVGRRFPLDREWRSVDSGRGSWRSASAFASAEPSHSHSQDNGVFDAEAGSMEPRYKIVMTGDTWRVLREHYPNVLSRVVARGAVFARMSSDQKQQLIVEYQALGYYVGMCGDGANDCGALRAAHTGISLSELESSVAAPFTSANPDIVCVARVLREGRAALSTSFGVFKFMVAYSLSEFFSVAFLYYFDSNLTDFQFLYIDVALIVNFAFFFASFQLVLALFFERFIIEYLMEGKQMIPKFLKEKRIRKTPHLLIKRELTDMDYLDCDSVIKYDKEANDSAFDSSGKGS
ncbi:hypothetical protein PYW07_011096 [Mythimna separata]|uniref:Cation-transporting ATPase n=1 Tax=Mythimna separata TaxID=271217 RepID=A0AAD8DKU9_MYTSE|nr:hypothetical protein PYW07_011096 [Mythimna separata]